MTIIYEKFQSSLNLGKPTVGHPVIFGPAGQAEFPALDVDPRGGAHAYGYTEEHALGYIVGLNNVGGPGDVGIILKAPAEKVSFRLWGPASPIPAADLVVATYKDEKGAELGVINVASEADVEFDKVVTSKPNLAGKIKSIVIGTTHSGGVTLCLTDFVMKT